VTFLKAAKLFSKVWRLLSTYLKIQVHLMRSSKAGISLRKIISQGEIALKLLLKLSKRSACPPQEEGRRNAQHSSLSGGTFIFYFLLTSI